LPVHRPLPYERVWRVVYQDHVLHTTPEIDELMQSRYGQCVGNVPDPLIPSYTLVHQHYIAHSLAHRCKHRRRQLHDGRRVNPPVPSEQRSSPIVDLHRHRDIEHGPNYLSVLEDMPAQARNDQTGGIRLIFPTIHPFLTSISSYLNYYHS
jgi:hypothetical protein